MPSPIRKPDTVSPAPGIPSQSALYLGKGQLQFLKDP